MMGAICGDVIGSPYEQYGTKRKQFPLIVPSCCLTDDTAMTIAIADAVLTDGDYAAAMRRWGALFPTVGYGAKFYEWLHDPYAGPYGSYGNGSAMRVSPIAFAFDDEAVVLNEAKLSAEVTHNDPEGIAGAQAVALAILRCRQGCDRKTLKREIERRFGYDLSRTLKQVRPNYRFYVTCSESVPESILSFLEATSVEDAIRNAISLGGDADTMACIAGSIAEAAYGRPRFDIEESVKTFLPPSMLSVIEKFYARYPGRPREPNQSLVTKAWSRWINR